MRWVYLLCLSGIAVLYAGPALATKTLTLERHEQVVRSGQVERFTTRRSFGASERVYATVLVDGHDAEVSGGDSYVQFVSRGVLVTLTGSKRKGPIRVAMVNLRVGTARVVCEFRWGA